MDRRWWETKCKRNGELEVLIGYWSKMTVPTTLSLSTSLKKVQYVIAHCRS